MKKKATGSKVKRAKPFVDEVAARELELYAQTTRELYPQLKAIIANIKRKIKAGKYSAKLAPKLWLYWYDNAAKRYVKEHGSLGDKWFEMFPKPLREHLARERAEDEYERIQRGEHD